MSGSDDDSDDDLSEASSYEDDGDFGLEDSTVVPPDVELKMVVCVRQDLNMSKGKIAAQVGHAVLACYRIACKTTPEFVKVRTRVSVCKWRFVSAGSLSSRLSHGPSHFGVYP